MRLDAIYCADSSSMGEVTDATVSLIVTSPPYNVGKLYDNYLDEKSFAEYLQMLNNVWTECIRVLKPGGRLAINIANTNRSPYIPLSSFITMQCLQLGLLMRGEFIWDKGASVGSSTAWGSFARASNPTIRDVHEYILVFSKDTYRLSTNGNGSGIKNDDFAKWTQSVWTLRETSPSGDSGESSSNRLTDLYDLLQTVWHFPTERAKVVRHPAPFPLELPRRLIQLYTDIGDLVVDPFVGSGSTGVAAKELRRHFIGYDISPEYCKVARRRVSEAIPIVPSPVPND